MKNRFVFVLPLLLAVTACAERYADPTDNLNQRINDQMSCAYEAQHAGKWGDDAFVDVCMAKKGYVVGDATEPFHWWFYPRQRFIDYDAKRQQAR